MTPIAKSTKQIVSASAIPSRIRNAFRLAEEERPGAVHLELPEDVARETTDATPITESYHRRPVVEDKAVARALELLREARRPILLIGAAANRKMTSRMLRAFVDKQGIPFVTTQMGKGVVDETHPLFLGNCAVSDQDFPHRALEAADCILNVGHDVVEKPPFFMNTGERKVIHVNFTTAEVDPVYFPQAGMVGDIALASMGAGLPSAMAAKMVYPDRRVLAVCGDGGFMMNSQDLETAVRLGLDLVVLVLNDSSYGMIRWKQAEMGLKDFVRYAESYGATGHHIAATADLGPTLEKAFGTGGVHLMDLPVDYSQNGPVLFHEIPEESAKLELG